MAVELAAAYISLVPSAKNIGAAISKEMSAPVEKAAQQSSDRVGGIFNKLAGVVGAAFVLRAGVNMFKGFVSAAEESRKVGAQTAAAIASTGGAANISAKQISGLAEAISKKTGVDDEAIQSGANLLLTFTNIRNEAGKGNDVFNQSTSVLTDMAAALGGDVSSNAIQLGKALNDPVAGISALTRVGVTFTDQQKDQIKAMVQAGDAAGAQKVILAELSKEFGGSAEAQATAGKKMSVAWGNLQEKIGGLALVVEDKLAPVFTKVIGFISDNALPVLGALIPVAAAIIGATIAWTVSTIAATLAEYAFLAPLILIVAAVAAVAFGVIYAYQHFTIFRTVIDTVGEVIKAVFNWVSDHWPLLLAILTGPFGLAVLVISDHFDGIKDAVETAVRFVVDKFLWVADHILKAADTAFGWVPKIGDKIHGAALAIEDFRDDVNRALGGIKDKDILVNFHVKGGSQAGIGAQLRAEGGPVTAGRPYWVGETGRPELFVPRVSGTIIPQAAVAEMPESGGVAGRSYAVTLNGAFDGPAAIAQAVAENLRRLELLASL